MEWEFAGFAICRPNGLASERCSGFSEKPRSRTHLESKGHSAAGNQDSKTGDAAPEINPWPEIGLCGDYSIHGRARQCGAYTRSSGTLRFRQSAWWRTQSPSNPSPLDFSLVSGKRTGMNAESAAKRPQL
jgi:hypothetical protein